MSARATVVLLLWASLVQADDWPAYRGDGERRAYSAEVFPRDLKRAWTLSVQAPTPAWPKPARRSYWQQLDNITARVTDDHGFHPVVLDGFVLFASSADDHLYCVRGDTGQSVWRFATDGPVRYAPYVSNGWVFFGSDDGLAYCVDLKSGSELWRRRLSDRDLRIPGNGRLVSSWPVRSGCLVRGNRVYLSSGLYPQQGAWVWALNAESGSVEWRTPIDASPQGYLLASATRLFVPTGRGQPLVLDLDSGLQLAQLQSLGGTFAVIDDDVLLSGPGNDASLSVTDSTNGARLSSVRGKHLSVGPQYSVLVEGDEIVRLNRTQFLSATRDRKKWNDTIVSLQALQKRSDLALSDREENRAQLKIAAEHLRRAEENLLGARAVISKFDDVTALVAMKEAVVLGGRDRIQAVSIETGSEIWKASTGGQVVGLALSDGLLVATTASGSLECFTSGDHLEQAPQAVESPRPSLPAEELLHERKLRQVLQERSVSRGYVVLIGTSASRYVDLVRQESVLKSLVFLTDEKEMNRERERLMGQGMYGARASVHLFKGGTLPLVGDFAALVVYDSKRVSSKEAQRLARPHGGLVLDLETSSVHRKPGTPGEGRWTHLYGNPANTAASRDQLASSDLALQWFGGVGPSRMVDRHLRGSSPLYDGGIMVVPGENLVIGVDAYSGEEQWELALPKSQRYSMPYDAGYMALDHHTLAVAVENECWIADTEIGVVRKHLSLPGQAQSYHWGYASFLSSDRLIGTWQAAEASRMFPSRERVDADYRDGQGLVCGRGLFAMNVEMNEVIWSRPSSGIVNPTLAVADNSVFFVEFMGADGSVAEDGRLPLAAIVKREPQLVAINAADGQVRWRVPLPESALRCRNILYLAYSQERLVLVGSYLNERRDTTYEVLCLSATDGSVLWRASHDKGKPGETYHGEQMHHPVIVGDYLVTEPVVYALSTGLPVLAEGQGSPWRLSRPGHSCGTISASEHALYFRAGNPTALDLSAHLMGESSAKKLSPTRPGCWINIIPAGGLVLIPEASAGCVCNFSLQTSMAFRPR